MRNQLLLWASMLPLIAASAEDVASTAARFDVGKPATAEMVRRMDISVLPNGNGLPEGQGTAAQGRAIYAAQCAACHGDHGEGADFAALVGGRGTLASPEPLLTVGSYWPYPTTLFDYIRRAMPYTAPGSLTSNDVYAVTAWLLEANAIIKDDFVLNRHTLAKVRMPNRDGFIADPRPDAGEPR